MKKKRKPPTSNVNFLNILKANKAREFQTNVKVIQQNQCEQVVNPRFIIVAYLHCVKRSNKYLLFSQMYKETRAKFKLIFKQYVRFVRCKSTISQNINEKLHNAFTNILNYLYLKFKFLHDYILLKNLNLKGIIYFDFFDKSFVEKRN